MNLAHELVPDPVHSHAPVVLVVAHPDDEVIGMGAQLSTWRGRLLCVHATNGAPADGYDAARAGFAGPREYAAARRRESERALTLAGLPASSLLHLPFVDQSLAHQLQALTWTLEGLLQSTMPSAVVTHPYEGGHPDHDAVSFAIAAAVARWPREDLGPAPRRFEFACYHEGDTGQVVTNRFGAPHHPTERRLVLDAEQRRQKQALLACFESQRDVLQTFRAGEEWLRTAPDYDYSRPPNGGRVWYDRFAWGIDSATWGRRASECLSDLSAAAA